MKKFLLALFISSLLFNFQNAFAVRWTELNAVDYTIPQSDVPHYRKEGVIYNLNNKIYYGGGYSEGTLFSHHPDFHAYDPLSNKWSATNQMPFLTEELSKEQSFTINNNGYYCSYYNASWKFDPLLNQWTQIADYTGSRRFHLTAFSANGKGYITLGRDSLSQHDPSTFEYDPVLNSWSPKAQFPGTVRIFPMLFNFPGGALLAGGTTPANTFTSWYYDATNDNWISKSPLPDTIGGSTCSFSIGNKGIFVNESAVWHYDFVSDTWSQKNIFLPLLGMYFSGVEVNGLGYLTNGESVFSYDPVADQWTILHQPSRQSHECIVYNDEVFFDGKKYDLISGLWTVDSLYSGQWMFTLGSKMYGIHNGLFRKFDPVTSLWSMADSLPENTVTISFSLAGFGYYISGLHLYQYDQVNDQWTQRASYPGTEVTNSIVFADGNDAYYGLGYEMGVAITEFWKYNATSDTWGMLSPGPEFGRMFYTNIGNKGYAGGGDYSAASNTNEYLWEYDMVTDTWTSLTTGCYMDDLPLDRTNCFCFNYQNYIYAGGGYGMYSHYSMPNYFDLWKSEPHSFTLIDALPSHLCVNTTYTIDYLSTTPFDSLNQLTVELSDSNGYFNGNSHLTIQPTSDGSGTLSFVIPPGNYSGNRYRLRVVSTSPVDCASLSDHFSIGSVMVIGFGGQVNMLQPGQQYNYDVVNFSGVNYFWDINNGTVVSGQGTSSVIIVWNQGVTGSITVVATDSSCSDTIVETVDIIPMGIDDYASVRAIAYPNPFTDFTTIFFEENITKQMFYLYDVTGQIVFKEMIEGNKYFLNRNVLKSGIYFYRLEKNKNGIGYLVVD